VKSFQKCVIITAFDGIEDEVLFEECWSLDNGNGNDDFRGLCNSRKSILHHHFLGNYLWILVLDGGALKFCFQILSPAYGLSNMVNRVFIITHLATKIDFSWHTAWCWGNWKILNVVGQKLPSNEWPFKSWIFCRVHWVLNSGARWLTVLGRNFYSPENVQTTKCMYATDLYFHRMSHSSVTWHASVYPFTSPLKTHTSLHACMSWVEQAYIRFAQSNGIYRYI
jgi:hypothetical protein